MSDPEENPETETDGPEDRTAETTEPRTINYLITRNGDTLRIGRNVPTHLSLDDANDLVDQLRTVLDA